MYCFADYISRIKTLLKSFIASYLQNITFFNQLSAVWNQIRPYIDSLLPNNNQPGPSGSASASPSRSPISSPIRPHNGEITI